MSRLLGILISILSFCILIGVVSHFTGLNIGEMLVSGFNQMKNALGQLN